MAKVFRWLLRLFSALAILGLAAMGITYLIAARSIPDYDEDFASRAIHGPVEIVRDTSGIPHIFADEDLDAYFALGFAHAQDRLWQMLTLRRTVQGRLSEYFGPRTFATDELMRRLDLYNAAVDSYETLTPKTRNVLAAYANGVNAWLEEINKGARGRGAPEFFLFPASIAPWHPADSVAIAKLMAVQSATQLQNEVLLARTSLLLSPERLADIIPAAPGQGVAALPEYSALAGTTKFAGLAAPVQSDAAMNPFPDAALSSASNAWAAAPKRSATGASLLANDPHSTLTAPSRWYLAHLQLSTGGVIGATIPGIPTVILGRSERLGWAMTSSYADDQDLFLEELNPANPNEVHGLDGYEPMTNRPSVINVEGEAPRTIDLRWTANGPVLPSGQFNLATVTPPGHVMSLGWPALSKRDTSMDFYVSLMSAANVDEALEAGASMVAPVMNLIVADHDDIAMKTVGALPRRDAGHQSYGRLPSPGWRAENRWQGRLPYSANPEFANPRGGILGNTNNKIVDRPFPFHVSYDWGDTQRVERWRRLMQGREVHTRDSFIEAQLDTVSFTARSLLPLIGADLWFTGPAAPDGSEERRRQIALEMLANWNGEMNEHLPEPLIYSAWLRALQNRLIRDELGLLAREFNHIDPVFIERVFRDIDGASAWCDVRQSAPVETCRDIASAALDDALIWLDENYGGSLASLRWGDAHEAVHRHNVLGQIPLMSWITDIRQSTSGGDNTLMRGVTSGLDPAPFANVNGAGYRGVYDFADPDASVFMISTGQSGHFLSRHYDDLGQLWRRGEYVPMSLDPDLARAGAIGTTTITPSAEE